MTETLRARILRHEGLRLKPYRDTVGKLTIGVGRNLDDIGISTLEAMDLLNADINRATQGLTRALPWVDDLPPVAREVLIEMVFQMGLHGVLQFAQTLEAFRTREWRRAAKGMRTSRWATQTPARVEELATLVEALAA